jgi:hypothetical protein
VTRVRSGAVGASTALAACVFPILALAFATGPVPGRTGGFGEMTCHECHWDNPLDEPSGRLTLSGAPSSYTPGSRYLITVDLSHPALVRGGFQLSARFERGPASGGNAGSLRGTDELTAPAPDEDGRIVYIQHTRAAVAAGSRVRWVVEWTAPEAGDPVIFHAAANASNGDDSALGDFIYTAAAESQPPGRSVRRMAARQTHPRLAIDGSRARARSMLP